MKLYTNMYKKIIQYICIIRIQVVFVCYRVAVSERVSTFQQSLTNLALPWNLPSAFATCVFVAVNTSHSGMIVLALMFDLTHCSFSWAWCGRLLPKQFFLSCLLLTHIRVSQLSCKLHQEVHPSLLPSGACLIQHMCIQCCHVNHVIEHGNWPAPCSVADSVLSHHLVHHIHAALCAVVKGDSVWLPFGGILSLNLAVHAVIGQCDRSIKCAKWSIRWDKWSMKSICIM